MSNENETALARVSSGAMAPNNMQPKNLDELWSLAHHVSTIGFCGHREQASAYICMMAGAEYGLSAIQSLRGIYVIEGKPSPSADMMVSFARRSRSCEYMRVKTSTATECVYEAKRVGEPEQLVSWTIAEAKQAGLLGRKNWKGYPADMLRARAAARCARQMFPEAVAGFHIAEEIEAVHAGTAEIVDPADGIKEHRPEAVDAELVDTVTEQFDALLVETVMGAAAFASAASPEAVVETFKAALATIRDVDGWHAIPPALQSLMLDKFKTVSEADRANKITTTIERAAAMSAPPKPPGDGRGLANRTFYAKIGEALNGDEDMVEAYKALRRDALGVGSFADLTAEQLNEEADHIANSSSDVWTAFTAEYFGDDA